jgi:hypothetical protein
MYYHFATESNVKYQSTYGKWNKYIFLTSVLSASMAFIMSIGAYLQTRKKDGGEDKIKNFVNI